MTEPDYPLPAGSERAASERAASERGARKHAGDKQAASGQAVGADAAKVDASTGDAANGDVEQGGFPGSAFPSGSDKTAGVSKDREAAYQGAADDRDPEAAALDVRRRRLLYRATHRGTFENDLMIGGFVRAHYDSLTEADVLALEAVMRIPDTDLAEWLTGCAPIPCEEETPMLRRMREFLAR